MAKLEKGFNNAMNNVQGLNKALDNAQGLKLSKQELQILAMLRSNSKTTITNMSRRLKKPSLHVASVLQSLERFVLKHTCLLDFEALGFKHHAFIFVRNKPGVLEFLANHPNVNQLMVSSDNIVLCQAVFKDFESLLSLENALQSIANSSVKSLHIDKALLLENIFSQQNNVLD